MALKFKKAYRILVVDDVPKNIQVIGTILRDKGLLVSIAQSGQQALNVVKQDPPDLILLDIMMPEMSGYETCKRLKEIEETKNIPIIFLSGLTDTVNKVQGFSFGAVDYVTKPIESDELLARIHSHLTIQSLTKELEEANLNLEQKVQQRTEELEQSIKELNNSVTQFRELQNNVPVGVYRSFSDGRLASVNDAMVDILGYDSKEELLNILTTDTYKDPSERERLIKKLYNNKIVKGEEIQINRKDGTPIWISISSKAIFDKENKIKYFDGIIEDITSRIKSKEQLLKAKEKAEEADHLKTTFLATMSHELRTPLNAIIGFSDILQSNERQSNVKDLATIINSSGNHLLNMIEDIFSLSLIETDEMKIIRKEFKPKELLDEISIFVQEEKKRRNKELLKINYLTHDKQDKLVLDSDKDKLKQIFITLLKNAIKFTTQGSVDYGIYSLSDTDITFYVKDTGIGIPNNKLNIIFDNFRQGDDSNTRLYGGLGIGLSIAKKLVELLNGKIWVNSKFGEGSEFYFSLPYTGISIVKEQEDIISKDLKNIKFTDKTILIAEDELSNFKYLESILAKTKANILWAENGQKAVDLAKKNKNIDLILMDLKMPVMDGYTAVRLIREFNQTIPIIVQTAYSIPSNDTTNHFITDSITKPIKSFKLRYIISKYI